MTMIICVKAVTVEWVFTNFTQSRRHVLQGTYTFMHSHNIAAAMVCENCCKSLHCFQKNTKRIRIKS